MASVIKIKRSSTGGSNPTSLQAGELAINLADKKLFSARANGQIIGVSGDQYNLGQSGNSTQGTVTLTVDNTTLSNDTIVIAGTNGVVVSGNSTQTTIDGTTYAVTTTGNSTVGQIVMTPTGGGDATSDTLKVVGANGVVKQIRSAHEDENTKAIVFRVNSPGGSIIASEMMRDELFAAKEKGIDVIVSMGDYAASGGVYISTPADYIFAEPTTITGSIGVAIALPTLENAIDYIGVNFDGVVTSKHGGWDPTQVIDEDLDKIFAGWGADAYDRFVSFVAESRSQSYEDIKAIAGGRVWIATSAKEIGLVDEIGGIDDAITYAANIAELEDYQVEYYGQELSPEELILRELLENFGVSLGEPKVLSALNGLADLYETLTDIQEPKALLTCKDCLVSLN